MSPKNRSASANAGVRGRKGKDGPEPSRRAAPLALTAVVATRATRATRIASALDCFRRVIRALRVAARRAEDVSALRPAQLFVLGQIAAVPNQSLTELASRTLTDRTSVASMVDRLATRGLAERVRGAEDRRRVEIRLTPAGRRVLARAPHSPTEHLLEGLERLDAAALDQLGNGLAELVRVMGVAEGPATMLFEDAAPRAARSGARRTRA
jgi:DNA-binding MarR family transcriptional regulator